jgi:DNA-binding PadR family transcriptional regulator
VEIMSLRHALLGLLGNRSGSGYDLMKRFRNSLGNVWPTTQSQLYGELAKLYATGRIKVVSEGPRRRKEYALTDAGESELRQWLLERGGEKPTRNEMLLQIFCLGLLSREQAVERLLSQADIAAGRRAVLVKLNASVGWDEDLLAVKGRLALEYGLRLRAMEEDWARWAAGQIRGSNGPAWPADAADGS